jgi:hypothetical protein
MQWGCPCLSCLNSTLAEQEVAVLARCRLDNITEYYASVLKPGTSELLIVMELMSASVADLVRLLLLHAALCMHRGPHMSM